MRSHVLAYHAAAQVRLRPYIEMRGADAGPLSHVLALPAFWVGLLYDRQAKAAALELIRDWTPEEMLALRHEVPSAAVLIHHWS